MQTDLDVYEFPAGIPGFEACTRFRLREDPRLQPLVRLENEPGPEPGFICVPVSVIARSFTYLVDPWEAELLDVAAGVHPATAGEPLCLAVLTLGGGAPTANLLAPVLLSRRTGRGVQAIQAGSAWSHVHRLDFAEEGRSKCS